MPRRKRCRWVAREPVCRVFKPAGRPACSLEEVALSVDELEAIRLSDLLGLNQADAAMQMNVSRATFGRIITKARNKIANALVNGMAIQITGGIVEIKPVRRRRRGGIG